MSDALFFPAYTLTKLHMSFGFGKFGNSCTVQFKEKWAGIKFLVCTTDYANCNSGFPT